jgi:hypothetical protein
MNIDKYLNNTRQTADGIVYKDEDAFNNNPKAICYISEYGLEDLMDCKEDGEDLTDKEIVEQGIGVTREVIRDEIVNSLAENNVKTTTEEVESKGIVKFVFGELNWSCLNSFLDNVPLDEWFFNDEEEF